MARATNDLRGSLYELPVNLRPLAAARGTILVLDWRALRGLGLYDRFSAALEPGDRDALAAVTAGSWVPLDLVLAHYRALDALDLDEAAMKGVGFEVANAVHGSFLTTLIRLAGKLGVSPWLALEQTYKLWVRSWEGGGVAVHRLGERLAEVTIVESPLCASRFYRTSMGGALSAAVAPFCRSPIVSELPGSRSPKSVAYRLAWTP
jgi:hypothetical protein